jgi:hypothetical protein
LEKYESINDQFHKVPWGEDHIPPLLSPSTVYDSRKNSASGSVVLRLECVTVGHRERLGQTPNPQNVRIKQYFYF